jgi:hypothetical protein
MDEQERLKKIEELKKQREELDKLISDLLVSAPHQTNIPYSKVYLQAFPPYSTCIDFSTIDTKELLKIKVFVNKKCNQISTDFSHTITLVDEILQYKDNQAFQEIFVRKLIDQGRVQVSGHFESYKPLGFILFKLNSPEMINMFVRVLINKQGSESELKGMYSIYFGFLNLKEDIDGCWLWLASVLNVKPSILTGYVLEIFLLVCGDLLNEKINFQFLKIIKYLKNHFIKELNNPAVESRISDYIKKFLV